MESSGYLDELNACHYLFLQELDEPRSNSLRIVLKEGRVSKIPVAMEVAGHSMGEGYPVEIDDTCSTLELTWDSYVCYQITDESFARRETAYERKEGKNARQYEKSRWLEYVMSSANASHEYPGKLWHFEILCANHLIDVISTTAPNCRSTNTKLRIN